MWWGYVASLLRRAPRYEEPGFRQFLSATQWIASYAKGERPRVASTNAKRQRGARKKCDRQ